MKPEIRPGIFKTIQNIASLSKELLERSSEKIYEVNTQKEGPHYDLICRAGEEDHIEEIVLIARNKVLYEKVDDELSRLMKLAEVYMPYNILLLVYEFIDESAKGILKDKLESQSVNLHFLDIQWITEQLNRNPDLIEKWISGTDDPEEKEERELVPFHLDVVVDDDKLGRDPVAKAFVALLTNNIFTDELNDSFMVHLQGEWGIGKSSFLRLIKKHLKNNNENWLVIDYNAWQHQHIDPPWWSFIDHVYKKTLESFKKDSNKYSAFELWLKESLRRLIWYKGWQKIASLILTLIFITALIIFGQDIYAFLAGQSFQNTITESEKLKALSDFAKLILTITTGIGVFYSFSNFLTSSLFIDNQEEAQSFVKRASDPMNRIKKHYAELLSNIKQLEGNQLAVFIDDIDRCNMKYIVALLEGIQTLFKDQKVLYVVAGDKKWITTSFGKIYKDFADENTNGDQLGELFLEKAFQLSFRMPVIKDQDKQTFWNYILGLKVDQTNIVDSFEKLDDDKKGKINEEADKMDDIANKEFAERLEKVYGLSSDAVSEFIIESKAKNKDELKHLLKGFHEMLNPNPRSIIRLANNYTMARSILIAERQFISPVKIFRWLVIEDLVPPIKHSNISILTINQLEDKLKQYCLEKPILENCKLLLFDRQNMFDGPLTMEVINTINGI